MTSRLSSAKTFRISFLQTLQRYWYHGAALLLLLLPVFGDLSDLFRHKFLYTYHYYETNVIDTFIFALNRYVDFTGIGYICLALGFSGMFLALACWRFLHVKKTVNVYFSLGQSRTNLFWSRFAACAVLLSVPVVLVFLVLLVCNLILFGSSWQLWAAVGIYTLSFIAVALFSFAVTTLAMSATGASFESFLCAGCLIAMPGIVFNALRTLSIFFLKGVPFDIYISEVLTGDTVGGTEFGTSFAFLNFFYPLDGSFENGMAAYKENGWQSPGIAYALTYLAATALTALIASYVFKKRKAENAGFLGKNPALVAVSCLSLSFLLVFPVYYLVNDEVADRMIVFAGVPILLTVYMIVMAILGRGRKNLGRALPAGLAVCAVFAAVCLCFVLDVSGYEERIPDKEDVVSVRVSSEESGVAVADYIDFYEYHPYTVYVDHEDVTTHHLISDHLLHRYTYSVPVSSELTSESDIDTVLQIHRKLIDAQKEDLSVFSTPVALQYTLKNGKTVTRYYSKATPEVVRMLQGIDSKDAMRLATEEQLKHQYTEQIMLIAPATTQITVLSAEMQETMQGGYELIDALVKDLNNGTLRESGFDASVPVGYIAFAGSLRTGGDDDYRYETYYTDYGSYTYGEDVTYAYVIPETVFDTVRSFTLDEVCEEYSFFDAYGMYPVYADMENTLAVLEQYDLLQYFDAVQMPVRAKVLRTPFADEDARKISAYGDEFYMRFSVFCASYTDGPAGSDPFTQLMPEGTLTDDEEIIAQLVSGACMWYDITLDGCFAAFEYEGGSSVMMYVPIDRVPQELQ